MTVKAFHLFVIVKLFAQIMDVDPLQWSWWNANISEFMKVKLREVSKYGVFTGPYFPTFGLNTEGYRVSLSVFSPNTGKYEPESRSVKKLLPEIIHDYFI